MDLSSLLRKCSQWQFRWISVHFWESVLNSSFDRPQFALRKCSQWQFRWISVHFWESVLNGSLDESQFTFEKVFWIAVSIDLKGRSHDPGNGAGPLSGINFSCVHMIVFIPPTGMKFEVDWYVYLKVWKINYVISSIDIFHPGRWDGVFKWENSSPFTPMNATEFLRWK